MIVTFGMVACFCMIVILIQLLHGSYPYVIVA